MIRSEPDDLGFVFPQNEAGETRAEEVNRQIVQESSLDDWLPNYVWDDGDSNDTGLAVACDQVHGPSEFAGFGTTAVLTIDPADLRPDGGTGVLAPADTVYASSEALYVAAPSWIDPTLFERNPDLAEELAEQFTQLYLYGLQAPSTPVSPAG